MKFNTRFIIFYSLYIHTHRYTKMLNYIKIFKNKILSNKISNVLFFHIVDTKCRFTDNVTFVILQLSNVITFDDRFCFFVFFFVFFLHAAF